MVLPQAGSETAMPRLYIAFDGHQFDPITISHWTEEGFKVLPLPFDGNPQTYRSDLAKLADELERGEDFAIVAYGDAASVCLNAALEPMPHLCALVAYYPSTIPSAVVGPPRSPNAVLHLAGNQTSSPAYRHYLYPETRPSFAEHDSTSYEKVPASIAWSRSLAAVRKGFKIDVDLEKIWENHVELEFATKDAAATMKTMVKEPYVNHIPTLTGGIGQKDLFRFYRDHFIPSNPPSMTMQLVSRTIGTDRVVDEMIISFKHTQEVPWMLPDVPPTDREVKAALVGVICIRGGKLYHEHLYWDQASVLVQVGLLDPKLVPPAMKERGLKRLPVYGAETAEKVIDEASHPSNELLSTWKSGGQSNGVSH